MKKIPKSLLLLLLLTAIWTVNIPDKASAATVINSPAGGECYKGGSTVVLDWTISGELFAHHSYVAYSDSSTFPASNQPSNISGGDTYTTKSPLNWTLPMVTGSTFNIKVTSMSSLNTSNSSAVSNIFSIDSSGPSAPSLTTEAMSPNSVKLSWSASVDPGCMPLSGYNIYRDNQLIATTTSLSYIDTKGTPDSTYGYRIQAYDNFEASDSQSVAVTLPMAPIVKSNSKNTPEVPGIIAGSESTTTGASSSEAKRLGDLSLTSADPATVPGKNRNYFIPIILIFAGVFSLLAAAIISKPALLPMVLKRLKAQKLKIYLVARVQPLKLKIKHLMSKMNFKERVSQVKPIIIAPTKTAIKHATSHHKKSRPAK